MPELPIQAIAIALDLVILAFFIGYVVKLHNKERELEKIRTKIDSDYHHIVDQALAKERKILEDATNQAHQIITGAQYVNKNSTEQVAQTLQTLTADIQKGTSNTAHSFLNTYSATLQQIAAHSITSFQSVAKTLEADLQKQSKDFHDKALPELEEELEAYRRAKMQDAERKVASVVQKVSQEILNKTISLEDHHALLVESLEKAKKEGAFQ